jgi:metallo-beta-lactamase class B
VFFSVVLFSVWLGQSPDQRAAWNRPTEPFRIIGNIYYVGAAGVSAFLITSPEGSILLDGGLPETALQIVANIAALGFDVKGVKYLLNSHAHFDHAGGLAELKRASGATMVASSGDAPVLRAGSRDMPAVVVDRIVADGEAVRVGNATLTAVITPGHTKGCTTWTMTTTEGGRPQRVLFYCSTSVVDRLDGNAQYPQIVEDYERSFDRLSRLEADVFLGNHPVFFNPEAKRKRMAGATANPFIDPTELQRFVAASRSEFLAALEKQRRTQRR